MRPPQFWWCIFVDWFSTSLYLCWLTLDIVYLCWLTLDIFVPLLIDSWHLCTFVDWLCPRHRRIKSLGIVPPGCEEIQQKCNCRLRHFNRRSCNITSDKYRATFVFYVTEKCYRKRDSPKVNFEYEWFLTFFYLKCAKPTAVHWIMGESVADFTAMFVFFSNFDICHATLKIHTK